MSKNEYIGNTNVKKLGIIIGLAMGVLLFFILSKSIWIGNPVSIISLVADLVFMGALFIPWLYNSKKKANIYLALFVIFALVSLFNEGIILNEGAGNMDGFMKDLLIKVFSFIIIKISLTKRPFSSSKIKESKVKPSKSLTKRSIGLKILLGLSYLYFAMILFPPTIFSLTRFYTFLIRFPLMGVMVLMGIFFTYKTGQLKKWAGIGLSVLFALGIFIPAAYILFGISIFPIFAPLILMALGLLIFTIIKLGELK